MTRFAIPKKMYVGKFEKGGKLEACMPNEREAFVKECGVIYIKNNGFLTAVTEEEYIDNLRQKAIAAYKNNEDSIEA